MEASFQQVHSYAEIGSVDNVEASFQQVSFVHFFLNFHNIVVKHQQLKISKEKEELFS